MTRVDEFDYTSSKDALLVRWDLDKSYRGVDYAYELYDYRLDPYERTNVFARYRNEPWVQDMLTKLRQYATCTPAQSRALALGQDPTGVTG